MPRPFLADESFMATKHCSRFTAVPFYMFEFFVLHLDVQHLAKH